jgi:hypothetical protein
MSVRLNSRQFSAASLKIKGNYVSMEDEINAPLGYEFTEMPKFALLDYEENGEVSENVSID